MFRCQYCQSHVFLTSSEVEWTDLLGLTECELAYEKIHQPSQLAEFYVTHPAGEVVYATENYGLVRIGNMRYWLPDDSHITTTEQLKNYKVTNDISHEIFLQRDLMRPVGRPNFEVRLESNPSIRVPFTSLDEAIKYMMNMERQMNPSHIKYAMDEVLEALKPTNMD